MEIYIDKFDIMIRILIYYLLAVNVVTFWVYGVDKLKAKKGKWRIPESTLLLMAAVGGSVGAWLGMSLWRHKTQHKKFKFGVPAIFVVQMALSAYIYYLQHCGM